MFSWLQKDIPIACSVFFRGTWPCTKEGFAHLAQRGIQTIDHGGGDNWIWAVGLTHPEWGEADLICFRSMPMPPTSIIDFDSGLLDSERDELKACGTCVSLMVRSRRKHLLRDRKHAVFFMDAVMGDEGVAAIDHVSEKIWSREALKTEVSHNADLDVQGLYSTHLVAVGHEREPRDRWFHTHGLAALGLFDFDLINPSDQALTLHADSIRAIAFAIVEGRLKLGGAVDLFSRAPLYAMPAKEFMAKAGPRWTGVRDDPENHHIENRAVLCDPAPTGLLAKLRAQAHPFSFLMKELPDNALFQFSTAASTLASERALATYPLFRAIFDELKELELPAIVKLGYVVDGGNKDDKEHLWFQVHEARENEVDATLANAPFGIARMKEGERGVHPIDLISDWQFLTPVGSINPRDTKLLRFLREMKAKEKNSETQATRA